MHILIFAIAVAKTPWNGANTLHSQAFIQAKSGLIAINYRIELHRYKSARCHLR